MTTLELSQSVEPFELSRRCDADLTIQVVDVREFPEYANGHIPRARLLPLAELARRYTELDPDLPVVVVCRSGKRSTEAARSLVAHGFRNVAHLAGGVLAWQQAGLPLEREHQPPWPLERQVRLTAGLLVLAGLGLSFFWPLTIVLAWFVAAGLVFAALTDTCGMALLLARMPWNRRQATLCK